ncbi:MAG: hypothetical protein ACOY93_01285 [Bacillota bacterium]
MAVTAPPVAAPHPARRRSLLRSAAALLLLPGLLWWSGPALLAPVQDFAQGPGAAVAYVSLSHQIREQSAQFWTGGDVQIRLAQEEFSGMLASALLTGRRPTDPIQRVRGSLAGGEVKVEAVLSLPYSQVPERFRGPIGLRLWLQPVVTRSGLVQFRITRAHAGRIPVSPALIRLAGRLLPATAPGFNAAAAAIDLPLSDMVSGSLGRRLEIKRFSAESGQLHLTIAVPPATN